MSLKQHILYLGGALPWWMTLDVSAGQAETLRDSSCEQPHGGDVFGNMSSINVVSKRLALQHVIVLCTVIVVNHGSQGELSVTREALVLRVASGELAKHRPILDFGGARQCMLCMISMFTLYDMMIYEFFKYQFKFVIWNIVCWWFASFVDVGWLFLCISIYLYLMIYNKFWIVRVHFEMAWLPDIWHPDLRQCDKHHRWITSSACSFGQPQWHYNVSRSAARLRFADLLALKAWCAGGSV